MPVLARGKTATGRLWAYVRDERPWAGPAPPAAWYRFSPDRRSEHPRRHLASFAGWMHADAYAGYGELYRSGVREVACLAHVRRKFVDVHRSQGSAIAEEAIGRIAQLYAVEKAARGQPPEERVRLRQAEARPVLDELEAWLAAQLPSLSGKSPLAGAIRHALVRLPRLRPCLEHGILEIDTDVVEQPLSWSPSARLGFGRSVLPGFDHARVGGLGVGHELHLPVTELLDPVVSPRAGLVAMLLGRTGLQGEADRMARTRLAAMQRTRSHDVIVQGLHQYLTAFIRENGLLHAAIAKQFKFV